MLRRLLLGGLFALASITSHAQESGGAGFGGTGGAPAASTASPGQQTPAPSGVPPVQTHTITNTPGQPGQGPQEAAREMQRQQREAAPQREAARGAQETTERNDFQDFITASTGQSLPLFGYNLFAGTPSTFAPVDNIPVTGDYVIGPGDELLIRAWGQIDVDYRAVVDRNGMVNIPRVGSVAVAGVPYKDITSHLRTAVARNFRNFELLVTMGQLRSIQVFVVGNARRPGAYTLSSLSTLVNAIFAVGGPSSRGSMRAIQLKRGNSVVTAFDVYDLLLTGDKSKDIQLLPGDVIYFPPIGPLAAVSGSVNNPAIFELKGQVNLGTLLDLAGGLTTTAQIRRASIERIDERQTRTVDQFSLDYDGLKRSVKDGDLVAVFSVSPRFENAVTLRGNVAAPLRYPFRPGMRILDLIPEKDALITPDYYRRQNLAARVDALSQGQLTANVRQLADEINWDYAVIERQNKTDLTTALIPFNLGKAVLENDAANNLALAPGDVVTIFSKSDIATTAARRSVVVRLEGEFNHAGVYQSPPGETLRQLVARVGGLTNNAYLFGAELTRESARASQQRNLDDFTARLQQDYLQFLTTQTQNPVAGQDNDTVQSQAKAQQALISNLKNVKPTGRVILQVPPFGSTKDIPDVALENGDRFFVPARPSNVNVFGSVLSQNSFLYENNARAADYVRMAGGTTRFADTSYIYLIRANGETISHGQSWFGSGIASLDVYPGDSIVVPENFDRTSLRTKIKDYSQILLNFGLGAAAVRVLTR